MEMHHSLLDCREADISGVLENVVFLELDCNVAVG